MFSWRPFKRISNFNLPLKKSNTGLISLKTFNKVKITKQHQHPSIYYCNFNGDISPTIDYPGKIYKKKNIISGIMSLSAEERLTAASSTVKGIQWRKFIVISFFTIIYPFTNTKDPNLNDRLIKGISNVFSKIPNISWSSEIAKLQEKAITIYQHLITLILSKYQFTYKELHEMCNGIINCDTYKGLSVNAQALVEMTIALIFKINVFHKDEKVSLINHEGLTKIDSSQFDIGKSIEQTGQMHADILVEKLFQQFYYDIKAYITLGLEHRRLFIFIYDAKLAKRLINDLTTSLQKAIKESILKGKNNQTLVDLFDSIVQIRKTTPDVKVRYIQIMQKCAELLFHPDLALINISLGYPIEQNIVKDDPLLAAIYENILNDQNIKDISTWFPKTPEITDKIREDLFCQMKDMVIQYVPEPFQQEFIDTLHTLFLNAPITDV